MHCIETHELSHRFSTQETVLDKINLAVPQGSIYGFLGPNGAGKTTTLRLILGLLKKQEGRINLFGKTFEQDRTAILRKTGSLIEAPSLYAHLTAAENLQVLQKIYQCPKTRINEVLEVVGLSQTGKKKTGRFSLGMKQRLSIAMALLHRPELLILDEPTNGLDPNGIIEIRELLKKLNAEEKVTIVISSHLLAEIEKLVTHLGIIHQGKLMFQGTMQALHQEQANTSTIVFDTSDPEKTIEVIHTFGLVPTVTHERIVIPITARETIAAINAKLVNTGIHVYQIAAQRNDLESIFIDLTKQQ
jgi:ABC-2 type transport system ATP-binding protein